MKALSILCFYKVYGIFPTGINSLKETVKEIKSIKHFDGTMIVFFFEIGK